MNVILRCLAVAALLSATARAQTEAPGAIRLVTLNAPLPQDPDLKRAELFVLEQKYQEAYDLLAPFKDAKSNDPDFIYWFGRAALGAKRADEAQALFERSLELRPDWVDAHLGLGRAYFALGDYGSAKIEFETVLRFDTLPPDLLTQVEIYDRAAAQYLDEERRLIGFAYLVAGIGHYWENPTAATPESGVDLRGDPFYQARGGFGLNYELPNSYAIDMNLDYRFRHYDNHEIRNESDWRWFAEVSRTVGESNLLLALRGRVSYRGNGQYRNDYGIYGDWRFRATSVNQFNVGAEVRRRRYPTGPLRDRSRTIGELTLGWTRSFAVGRGSFSINGSGGYEWATSRPDGNSSFYGAFGSLNFLIADRLDGFLAASWQHDSFSDENRFDSDPAEGRVGTFNRTDNIYEVGGGLVWRFAPGWSLRLEALYDRDTSNAPTNEYNSTTLWINVWKDF